MAEDFSEPAEADEVSGTIFKRQTSFHVHQHLTLSMDISSTPNSGLKAKRRRTSPQDHAVLEAAYQRNPKPDKNARAEIVGRVQLGEKEVQIWFQNRRQNDRRRSKPLEPHELVAHLRNAGVRPIGSQPISPPVEAGTTSSAWPLQCAARSHPPQAGPPPAPGEDQNRPDSRASSIHELLNPASSAGTTISEDGRQSVSPTTTSQDQSAPASSIGEPRSSDQKEQAVGILDKDKSSISGSGRKRAHGDMLETGETETSPSAPTDRAPSAHQKEPLSRSASMVRLAMTVDGAVKVRTNNEPTPSPPKQRELAPAPTSTRQGLKLTRSKSVANGLEAFRPSGQSTIMPGLFPVRFGRSRDARTWEFYCDSTAKETLSVQAEAETAGSAISAINLIRSNSHKSRAQALSPSLSKANPRAPSAAPKAGKPRLSRARSSMARLQGFDGASETRETVIKQRRCDRSPSRDSDKENWAPGTRNSEHPLRRTQPTANHRPILQDNEGLIFRDPPTTARPSGRLDDNDGKRPLYGKENAKGEDFDCIQGLLSLSQGAWR